MRKKCDFWDFKGMIFLLPKKVSFYLEYYETLFLAFFWRSTNKEENGIFGQNHGLTPLQNLFDFWDFKGMIFLLPKKVSFSSRIL